MESVFKLMESCVQEIHYGDDVYQRADMSDKDISEFIDQLTGEQFEKISDFFSSMPKVRHIVKDNKKKDISGQSLPNATTLILIIDVFSMFSFYK